MVRIYIYNISGNLIRIIEESVVTSGYRLPPVTWDGNTEGGQRVGRGIYPYSVIITTSSGETTKASGRMIIL
jgi:flagellar hook assembly protein FlgD